jgi:hypothetical protein
MPVAVIAAATAKSNVPGSGTGAIGAAADTTGAGTTAAMFISNEGSPTAKLVPSAIAPLLVTINVPLLTVVPPV